MLGSRLHNNKQELFDATVQDVSLETNRRSKFDLYETTVIKAY